MAENAHSDELLKAQERLQKRRAEHAARKAEVRRSSSGPDLNSADPVLTRGGASSAAPSTASRPGVRQHKGGEAPVSPSAPGRVGGASNNGVNTSVLDFVAGGGQWGSENVTEALQRALANRDREQGETPAWEELANEARRQLAERERKEKTVGDIGHGHPSSISTDGGAKNYTSLGLAVKRAGETKFYRVWLLARYLDAAGSGWVAVGELREALCASGSPLRISKPTTSDESAWRNLRSLMNGGEGRYWTRETGRHGVERLRYVTPADLALALGLEHLIGDPVIIPVEILTSSIADLRAHLVASIHAARQGEDDRTAPISRGTLVNMTGASERTLRRYDKRAGVDSFPNYEIGGVATTAAMQDAAWEHGTAVFEFVDYKGYQGRAGQHLIARVLPNSYSTEMQTAPRGRQRKINRKLRDACDQGAQANDGLFPKIFHEKARDAVSAFNREPDVPRFYLAGESASGAGLYRGIRV
jgi:hypothetical protein